MRKKNTGKRIESKKKTLGPGLRFASISRLDTTWSLAIYNEASIKYPVAEYANAAERAESTKVLVKSASGKRLIPAQPSSVNGRAKIVLDFSKRIPTLRRIF